MAELQLIAVDIDPPIQSYPANLQSRNRGLQPTVRYAFPPKAERPFGRAFHAQPCSPGVLAEPGP